MAICSTCDTTELFVLTGTSCSCITGYYLLGSVCTDCPTGCTVCDATGTTCSGCDTANGFVLDIGTNLCICSTGSYLPVGGTVCSPCSAIFSMCLACTATSCSSCQSPAIVSGSSCACPSGYYNNTLSCQLCSGQFLGCTICTLGSCTTCDTSLFFSAVPSSNVCPCQPGYIMLSSTCT